MSKTANKKNQENSSSIDLSEITDSSKYIKIGEASKIVGVSIDTLRRWERKGWIKTVKTPGGTRLYDRTQLQKLNPNLRKGPKPLISPLIKANASSAVSVIPSASEESVYRSFGFAQDDKILTPSILLSSDQSNLITERSVAAEIVSEPEGSVLEDESLKNFVLNFKRGLFALIIPLIVTTALLFPGYLLTTYLEEASFAYLINTETASNIYKAANGESFEASKDF